MTDHQRAADTAGATGGRSDPEAAEHEADTREQGRERVSEDEGAAVLFGPEEDDAAAAEPVGGDEPGGSGGTGTSADSAEDPADDGSAASKPVSEQTVESVVRGQLSKALGGKRGMVETAIPTLAFTLGYMSTEELRLSLGLGFVLAIALAVVRLVQRSSVQFVVNSLFGMAIAAIFALRSGDAEDFALPGIIYNAVYAVVLTITILIRWPAMGLLIGGVTGDLTAWRENPAVVRLSSRLTWLLVLPCVVRVAVQFPLWAAESYGVASTFALLGIAKIAMGWPLQVAAFAGMVWLLARGRTPVDEAGIAGDEAGGGTGERGEAAPHPMSGPRAAE
ncbi:DUF3159 domain-containing protein [Streptomonospora litoralis]|uniref:DUF3159 domain-containing protein n=1 Tax=Streptomonospora litoralis TaxID=2498135 RepID=A0A4P6Q5U7_9ACTN|nr:DUF3159 domain-containing protein [Streptomonospora litoralis]QBI54731.1 hypothetical protein EKD16_14755 [Streptomonospora litoralis]